MPASSLSSVETRSREFRVKVHLVGAGEVLTQLRMQLCMYHTVIVEESPTLNAFKEAFEISPPDCVAALMSNHHWGRELIEAFAKRPPRTVVFLVPKLTPKLARMIQMVSCQFTYGRRGLAMRGASLVAQCLELPPRVTPQLSLTEPAAVRIGDSVFEGELLDLCGQAAAVRLPRAVAEMNADCQLRLALVGRAPLEIPGRFEIWLPPKDNTSEGLMRFGAMDQDLRKRVSKLVWVGTERVLSGQRSGDSNGLVRSSSRARPDGTFKARVNPEGERRMFYYRVENIGRSGILLSSTGVFDSGLTIGLRVDVRVICPRGPVHVQGTVTRVLPCGVDPQRPAYHGVALEFDQDDAADLATIDRLVRYVGLDGVI